MTWEQFYDIYNFAVICLSILAVIFFIVWILVMYIQENRFKKPQPYMIVYERFGEDDSEVCCFHVVDFAKTAEKAKDKAKNHLESCNLVYKGAQIYYLDAPGCYMIGIAEFGENGEQVQEVSDEQIQESTESAGSET